MYHGYQLWLYYHILSDLNLFFCRTRVQLQRRESCFVIPASSSCLLPITSKDKNQKPPQLNTRVTKKKKATQKCVKKIGFWKVARRRQKTRLSPSPPAFFYSAPNSAIELPSSDPLALNFKGTCTCFFYKITHNPAGLLSRNDFHFYQFSFEKYEGYKDTGRYGLHGGERG